MDHQNLNLHADSSFTELANPVFNATIAPGIAEIDSTRPNRSLGLPAEGTLLGRAFRSWQGREDEPAFSFIVDGKTSTRTFREQLADAMSFAREYRKRGLRQGDIVIIIAQHGPQLTAAFLGALWIGAVPSFMPLPSDKQDRKYYWESHVRLFQRIQASLLVTDLCGDAENEAHLDHLSTPIWDMRYRDYGPATEFAPTPVSSESIAFLQHSSGTTSLKKGVALSHRAVLAQADSYGAAIGLRAGQTIVSWLPLYHDMGLIACFILPFLAGIHVVTMCPFAWVRKPSSLLDALDQHSADYCWLPNFAFNLLALTRPSGRSWNLSSVKAFINCSEPCKADTFRQFAETFADCGVQPGQLQVCYAMAETVYAITQTELNQPVQPLIVDALELSANHRAVPALVSTSSANARPTMSFLPVGSAISGMRIQIFNQDHIAIHADGLVGEIGVSGSSLFHGYHLLPEETRARRIGEWHLTGDLGFIHQGKLYVTGRKGDVIVVRGKKFHGFDIEHVVSGVAGVKPGRSVAFGCDNPQSGSEDAIVVTEFETNLSDSALRTLRTAIRRAVNDALGLMLADVHLVPSRWIVKTTSGKISRHLNAEKYKLEKSSHV